MSAFEHGEPEDGDLVEPSSRGKIPKDVSEAIRTLIRWAGDDPDREGLLDTPAQGRQGVEGICPRLCRGSGGPSQPHL
jgi:GTP cyclohydrolase I